jgi:hypothetical protein
MTKKSKKSASATIDPSLTLRDLSGRYIEHLKEGGWSQGTAFSYSMELQLAQSELGADTRVAEITPEQVAAYFECARVTRLKGGKKLKAEPSVAKTRRVLRLALAWAAQAGLIAASPIPAKGEPAQEAAPEKKARKTKRAEAEVATSDDAPAPDETASEPVPTETAA